jgi:predicted ester cyclase
VQIEDMIAEDDKVVVRNHWTATDSQTGKRLEFRGIVIWRIAARKIVERWAYLEAPHPLPRVTHLRSSDSAAKLKHRR